MNIYAIIYVWVNVCMKMTFILPYFINVCNCFYILWLLSLCSFHLHQPTAVIKSHIMERVFVESIHSYSWGSTTLWSSVQWKHFLVFTEWKHSSMAAASSSVTSSSATSSLVTSSVKPFIMESSSKENGSKFLLYQHPIDARKWKPGSNIQCI